MTLASTYIVRHIQHYAAQVIENVYFFNHTSGDGLSTDLALDFEGEWLPLILALQFSGLITDGLSVYNMADLGDFANLPLVSNGTAGSGDPLPSFNAVGYTFKLNTRAVRPGSKRIAGTPEGVTTGNNVVDAGYLAAMEALRLAFQSNLVGASDTWTPIVVKRVKTPVVGTVPLQYQYRLPETEGDFVAGTVVAALTSPALTSQVSRKA